MVEGYRLGQPEGCPAEYYAVMSACWADVSTRPSFTEIVKARFMSCSRVLLFLIMLSPPVRLLFLQMLMEIKLTVALASLEIRPRYPIMFPDPC